MTRGRKPVEHIDTTPQPPLGKPRMPTGMNTLAKAEWKRVIPMLDSMGVTSKIDGALVAVYCSMYARWMQAEAMLEKEGHTVECANGYVQPSQWLGIGNSAVKLMMDAMNDLGMTPKARQKLKALPRPKPEADKWADFNMVG
jgi:P27 family predicted phage terminase small subunit